MSSIIWWLKVEALSVEDLMRVMFSFGFKDYITFPSKELRG